MKLQGRIVIITGASGGIGAATARELARLGATVVLAARRADELQAVAEEITQRGGRALAVQTDVTRREDIDRLVQTTLDAFGRVDGLVNNAGITSGSDVVNVDDAALERIFNVNVLAPTRAIQAVLPQMRKQGGGVIVNIGSVAGEVGVSGVYSATKFAIRGLSDALRRDLLQYRIAVVLVEPGYIRTAMTTGLRLPMPGPEAVARAIASGIQRPRRRIIVPWGYAPFAYFAKLVPGLIDVIFGSRVYQQFSRGRERTR